MSTGGIGATRGVAGGSVTAASRGALLAMVPSLALELVPRRIASTPSARAPSTARSGSKSGLPAEQVAAMVGAVAARTPLGRLGTTREIAETVAFLASDGAAYLTEQNIVVAGGSGLAA